jgi:hypothetical protein
MNKPILTYVLLGLLAVNALFTMLFAWQYKASMSRLGNAQIQIISHNENITRTRNALQNVVREAAEYAKVNPAIAPILQMVGVNVPTAAPAPAAAKPATPKR